VLSRLLAGESEKEAARRLGLSRATVHEYVTDLYAHFGVHTRAELLARCADLHPMPGTHTPGTGPRGRAGGP
jgi:DNA-binding NarL/FixJ family response regulator